MTPISAVAVLLLTSSLGSLTRGDEDGFERENLEGISPEQ
jgi:hypothetical protein